MINFKSNENSKKISDKDSNNENFGKKDKKSINEKLSEKIFQKKKSLWLNKTTTEKDEVFKFCEEYKNFLNISKTEREVISYILEKLKSAGFKDITKVKNAKKGDKIFKIIKEKALFAFVVGSKSDSFQLVGSHIDSPRLDLKPHPLYEDSGLSMMKTHYYGGIKKYHWVNIPLALHGVAYTKTGKRIDFKLGEKDNESKFIIPDVLPHLAKNQMKKDGNSIVEGEELNIVVGNMPVNDDKIKEQVKFTVLKFLYDNYGLIEEDFTVAELQFVPAGQSVDIGVDKSMIAGYGQDDRVCAYTELQAILNVKNNKKTAVAMFVDKEEVGSMGNTGAASNVLKIFTEEYIDLLGLKIKEDKILENSIALSGDVTCGMNPNYKDVNDSNNVSFLSFGVSIEKYGGGGGKYSTNDAHAEYMQYLRQLADKHKIKWQTGELGKIDIGGGGTIAMYISKYGLDCVDAGPPVLGMHSPCELTSKIDIFETYRMYKCFLED